MTKLRRHWFPLLLVLCVLVALTPYLVVFAQVSPQIQGSGAPANPCNNGGQQYVDQTNHVIYSCPSTGGNWVNIGLGAASTNGWTNNGSTLTATLPWSAPSATLTGNGNSNVLIIHAPNAVPNGLSIYNDTFSPTGTGLAAYVNNSGNAFIYDPVASSSMGLGANNSVQLTLASTAITANVPLLGAGTAATLSGTGACATITTQTGGSWSGSGKCTGTTGASTFVIQAGLTASNGYSCFGSDITAGTALAQSASSTTTCTLKAATVTANDFLTFTVNAF